MDDDKLEALLERAAKRGAREALESIGLHDEQAVHDVRDLRTLLEAWRATKRTVWRKVVEITTIAVLGAVAAQSLLSMKGWK